LDLRAEEEEEHGGVPVSLLAIKISTSSGYSIFREEEETPTNIFRRREKTNTRPARPKKKNKHSHTEREIKPLSLYI
jgi:hypothetical protein